MTDGTRFFGFFLAILLFQIIGGLLPRNSFAQEGYSDPHSHCELQQPPELYSVSFTGFSGATGITLIKPETGETITAPEWLDANLNGNTNDPGDKNDTAAEPMQTAFLVRVAFNFANTAVNPGCVHVWAQGTFGGLASQSSPVTVGSDGTAILQVNSPSQTVDFEGNASWTFMCMIGSDTSVQTIGTSTHVICVPHGVTQSCYPYDLVMIASCQSCQGLGTTPRQVADAVYNGLAANAKNRAGTLMTYALNAPGDNGSIAKLVQNHAGSCES